MNGKTDLSRRQVVIGGISTLAAGTAFSFQTAALPDRIDAVLRVVSEQFGVSVEELQSASRAGRIAQPRRIAMYLAHRLSGETPAVIGQRFGGRDSTSVLLASRKLRERVRGDPAQARVFCELERRCIDMTV